MKRPISLTHLAQESWRWLAALLAVLLCAVACQPRPQPADLPAATAVDWPGFDYAAADRGKRFRLDPAATRIDIVVRRAGPLARFGHDHVISAADPEGLLLLEADGGDSRADLRFAVGALIVDANPARERYGLDTNPDADAIEGTRANLLEHVLQPTDWPWITIALRAFRHEPLHYSAEVTIEVNGRQRVERLPFRMAEAEGHVSVETDFSLRQTDLGLQPFSTLGGGLQVADAMEVHVRIEADAF